MSQKIAAINVTDVLDRYCDLDGLTPEECQSLDIDPETSQLLITVLGPDHHGLITPEKKQSLSNKGFSQKFIDELAGPHGSIALHKRAQWFANRIVTHWYRPDFEPAVRAQMIHKLGSMGSHAMLSVENMIEVLEDSDEEAYVRQAAAEALGRITEPREDILVALKKILSRSEDRNLYPVIIATIGKLGADNKTRDILKSTLRFDPQVSWQVRHAAAKALGQWGESAAGAELELAAALHDESWWVKRYAAGALGTIGLSGLVYSKTLADLLEKWPEDEAMVITQVLARMGNRVNEDKFLSQDEKNKKIQSHLIAPLVAMISSPSDSARKLACATLGQMGALAINALESLLSALEDNNDNVSDEALKAAINIGKHEAGISVIETLIRELGKEEGATLSQKWKGCMVSLIFIARVNDEKAKIIISALRKAVQANYVLIIPAAIIFKNMGALAIDSVADLHLLLQDKTLTENQRRAIVVALDFMGQDGLHRERVVPSLILALEDTSLSQRAQEALGRMGPVVMKALSETLVQTGTVELQHAILNVLSTFKPDDFKNAPEVVARFVATLKIEDTQIRDRISQLLLKIGAAAEPALVKGIEGSDLSIQIACLDILGKLGTGHEKSIKTVIDLLGHDDENMNQAAHLALARLGLAALPALATALLINRHAGNPVRIFLQKSGGANAVYFFREQLKAQMLHPDPILEMKWIRSLAAMGDVAVPALLKDLLDPKMKGHAAMILGLMGPEARMAMGPLLKLLQGASPEFTKLIYQILERIGGIDDQKTLSDLFAGFAEAPPEIRMGFLKILEITLEKNRYKSEILNFLGTLSVTDPNEKEKVEELKKKGGA